MALWHLQELQSALEQRGWRLSQELPGDDHKISATWLLTRSGAPPNELHLDFEGLDEKRVLPLAEAYACQVRGASQSLYSAVVVTTIRQRENDGRVNSMP